MQTICMPHTRTQLMRWHTPCSAWIACCALDALVWHVQLAAAMR